MAEMADVSQVGEGVSTLNMSERNENYFDRIKKTGSTSSPERLKDCFTFYDQDK